MKSILLSQGLVALVDDCDYESVCGYTWSASYNNGTFYAKRTTVDDVSVLMHRQILDAPDDMEVDHKNHNGLDNQRHNIRVCTVTQNHANTRKRTGTTSKYKGVSYESERGKWTARIFFNGGSKRLGRFHLEDDAAQAYNNAALEMFGEFALLNLIEAA